jgi:hypothetical protein
MLSTRAFICNVSVIFKLKTPAMLFVGNAKLRLREIRDDALAVDGNTSTKM